MYKKIPFVIVFSNQQDIEVVMKYLLMITKFNDHKIENIEINLRIR